MLSRSPRQETSNTEIQITTVQPGGEVELPVPDEDRIAIQSLENDKYHMWIGQAYQQKYIKLEGQLWKLECLIYIKKTIWMKVYLNIGQSGVISPIYKNRDKIQCSNCRGMSLLCTAYKIFTTMLLTRLKTYSESIIGKYKAGFRKGRFNY